MDPLVRLALALFILYLAADLFRTPAVFVTPAPGRPWRILHYRSLRQRADNLDLENAREWFRKVRAVPDEPAPAPVTRMEFGRHRKGPWGEAQRPLRLSPTMVPDTPRSHVMIRPSAPTPPVTAPASIPDDEPPTIVGRIRAVIDGELGPYLDSMPGYDD